jgi:hypothetical protein
MVNYPEISNSITNPNVLSKDSLDLNSPMSFLTFIKNVDPYFDSSNLQEYYVEYLKTWNNIKNSKNVDTKNTIIERYKEFIQEISLNYTNLEEKNFLSKINFNDPLDLDLAIPFYTRKLIEISNYYKNKREEAKYQVITKNLKGTNSNTESNVKNLALNYLENLENGTILYDFESLKSKIEVEIEELYDSYPSYFNQIPDEKIYDNKDFDYGLDIFLKSNDDLIDTIFKGVSDELKRLKESDQLFDNKRALTEKYLATDFYFLSTGSTVYDFISGKASTAKSPSLNILNVNYPTTASTDRKNLSTPREKGFFRPHKTSILFLDGKTSNISINFEKLTPNTIYYFPDPSIHGVNGNVLIFSNDDFNLKRNISSGKAKNQPVSKKEDSKYYGYISQTEIFENKYLDKIFESGYIQDSKFDIYNNLFGLFKNDGSFRKTIQQINLNSPEYFLVLNGHTFYDFLYGEGYSFDYTIEDSVEQNYTTRSGLSTNTSTFTNPFSSSYNILFGGRFNQKSFYYPESFKGDYQILEGFNISDGVNPYPDTISSDLSVYPSSGQFYYSKLIEGGIHTASPLQRALLDPLNPSLSADATQEIISDGVNTFLINGGEFFQSFPDFNFELPSAYYDPTVNVTSSYVLSTSNLNNYYERYTTKGKLFVRNAYTNEVKSLEDTFSYFSSIFPLSTYNEMISGVSNFEIVNDVLFIETDNNLIITKISFNDGEFVDPKTSYRIIKHNINPFNKISNRYRNGNKVYFSLLDITEYPPTSNNFTIFPKIYEVDMNDITVKVNIPDTNTNFFQVSGGDIQYVKSDTPILSYDSRPNIYNVSFLLKDSNNEFILQDFDIVLNPFEVLSHSQIKQK